MKEKTLFFEWVTSNTNHIILYIRHLCIITVVAVQDLSVSLWMPKLQQHKPYPIRCYIVLYVLGELFLVGIFILLHQVPHVIGHILAHDVLAVNLSIELFAFRVVARETFGAVKQQIQAHKGANLDAKMHAEMTDTSDSPTDNWGIGLSNKK